MNLKRYFYTVTMFALFTLLVGCPAPLSKKVSDFDDTKNADYYLSQADSSFGSIKIDWQLLAVRALVKENQLSQASTMLSNLSSNINAEQQKEKLLLQGEIAIKTHQSFSFNGLSPDGLSDSQLFRYYTIKLVLDGQNKDINAQAHDYLELEKYAKDNQKNQIINDSWRFFSKLNSNEVSAILTDTNETVLKGWIELIYAYQNNVKAPAPAENDTPDTIAEKNEKQKETLKKALNNWLQQYSDHPAKIIVSGLTGGQVLAVDNVNAKKVALLLPLSGSSSIFGNTIRQGYFDATKFFSQEPQQNIVVLDTTSASMDKLLEQAKEQNVELIVGPLLKEEVSTIKQLAPTIPVLALNKIDDTNFSTNKMCFFSLSPEDEAKDAANHIYSQHKLKPLLLVPKTDLGQRVAQSFAKQWQQISSNNSPAYIQYFGNAKTLAANMNRNVGINLRGEQILTNGAQAVAYTDVTGDFDAVYIYSSYDELTLIKPMLDMGSTKFVSNPSAAASIYSSSKSHVANASTDFYFDMERTQFAEIPMIVNQSNITNILPSKINNDYSLMRLYALGIDAWRLANRFNQLDSNQSNVLEGMTGQLSTINQCEVMRSLIWQQYTRDAAQPASKSE